MNVMSEAFDRENEKLNHSQTVSSAYQGTNTHERKIIQMCTKVQSYQQSKINKLLTRRHYFYVDNCQRVLSLLIKKTRKSMIMFLNVGGMVPSPF